MDQPTPAQGSKHRWGQIRRLSFIDVRLQYDGRINRSDLMAYFQISMPQASADLGLYHSQAPRNMVYDSSARVYVSEPGFDPLYRRSSASRYLDDIHRLARGVIEGDESFVGFKPPTGVVETPARTIEANEVATLIQAIRDRRALRVRYQSMDHPTPLSLVLSPHALGFDGLRWHVRAWCHTRAVFRDFAIGRLEAEGAATDVVDIDPALDTGWTTYVPVVLVPHPKLSAQQRVVVMRDYGMQEGQLVLKCRKAMLFYTLRHLNLESLEVLDQPARQHVVIKNREDVARWVEEDRQGNTELVGARFEK